ncbi:acetyltransferase [Fulvivirga sediminis]|uniref:Acetyltransferase n=1 Tax=Fulvivirga sediminis TaxID=2803949 RepID=A0A937FA17_9BACT|nr:acetyltransferase [Fulvivirga sediminis]MBL3656688.1 acetyltransferase [Fulvivirga sediminis]
MKNPVMIFGANSMGRAARDIFDSNDIMIYGFLDDDEKLHGTEMDEISVLGATDDDGFLKYIGKKCEAFIAIDDNKYRKNIVKMLNERRKVMPVNAIHQASVIAGTAYIGHGNFINMGARVADNAKVGNHCILNTNSVVDYSAELGDFVQLGAGSVINTGVHVGNEVFIGSGVTIVSGVKIGKGARIGAGSVVIADVEAGKTVFGNPAQVVER